MVMQQTLNLWILGSSPSGSTKYPWLIGLGTGLQHQQVRFDSEGILQHVGVNPTDWMIVCETISLSATLRHPPNALLIQREKAILTRLRSAVRICQRAPIYFLSSVGEHLVDIEKVDSAILSGSTKACRTTVSTHP